MSDTDAGHSTGSGAFPVDGGLHQLEIRLQAIQLSPYSAGPATPHTRTPGRDRCFPGMLLSPSPFRIQVSHQTQEPPSEFLPAAPGIQQGAARRTSFAADSAPAVGVHHSRCVRFGGPTTRYLIVDCMKLVHALGQPCIVHGRPVRGARALPWSTSTAGYAARTSRCTRPSAEISREVARVRRAGWLPGIRKQPARYHCASRSASRRRKAWASRRGRTWQAVSRM
jgi:hypothetical protein